MDPGGLSDETDPREQALQSLEDFSRFCEQPLFDFVPQFELKLQDVVTAINNYRQGLTVDGKTKDALSKAITQFRLRSSGLIYYYGRHYVSSQSDAADGLAFVDSFSALQLKILEESMILSRLLAGIESGK